MKPSCMQTVLVRPPNELPNLVWWRSLTLAVEITSCECDVWEHVKAKFRAAIAIVRYGLTWTFRAINYICMSYTSQPASQPCSSPARQYQPKYLSRHTSHARQTCFLRHASYTLTS